MHGQLTTTGNDVYFSNSGNVGIGTATPSVKLSVVGNISLTGTAPALTITERLTIQSPMVTETNFTRSFLGQNIIWKDNTKRWSIPDQTYSDFAMIRMEGNGVIGFYTKPINGATADFQTTSLEGYRRMTIEKDGKVGIGTATPQTKLDVNGVIQVYNKDVPTGTQDNLQMWSEHYGSFIHSSGDENGLSIKSKTGNKIMLESNVTINSFNHHGYRLAVNGNALFTKIIIKDLVNWPDYVFADDYVLRPLKEVQSFIQQHKHLPDVPSAEETRRNGIDVSENQAVLLRKVEELTLYILQQEEKIQELTRKMEALEKQPQH